MNPKRERVEKIIYETFDILDPRGVNTKFYKDFFGNMTDAQFDSYMRDFIDKTYTVHSEACKAAYYIKLIRKTVHSSCRSFRRDSRFILRTIEEKRDSLATY